MPLPTHIQLPPWCGVHAVCTVPEAGQGCQAEFALHAASTEHQPAKAHSHSYRTPACATGLRSPQKARGWELQVGAGWRALTAAIWLFRQRSKYSGTGAASWCHSGTGGRGLVGAARQAASRRPRGRQQEGGGSLVVHRPSSWGKTWGGVVIQARGRAKGRVERIGVASSAEGGGGGGVVAAGGSGRRGWYDGGGGGGLANRRNRGAGAQQVQARGRGDCRGKLRGGVGGRPTGRRHEGRIGGSESHRVGGEARRAQRGNKRGRRAGEEARKPQTRKGGEGANSGKLSWGGGRERLRGKNGCEGACFWETRQIGRGCGAAAPTPLLPQHWVQQSSGRWRAAACQMSWCIVGVGFVRLGDCEAEGGRPLCEAASQDRVM